MLIFGLIQNITGVKHFEFGGNKIYIVKYYVVAYVTDPLTDYIRLVSQTHV